MKPVRLWKQFYSVKILIPHDYPLIRLFLLEITKSQNRFYREPIFLIIKLSEEHFEKLPSECTNLIQFATKNQPLILMI